VSVKADRDTVYGHYVIPLNNGESALAFGADCHIAYAGYGFAHIRWFMGHGYDFAAVSGGITQADNSLSFFFQGHNHSFPQVTYCMTFIWSLKLKGFARMVR
jgi:hypothetical protein